MDTISQNLLLGLIVGGFVGAASGYLGSVMVLKRMALVGDALSHVALPGIGIALTYHLNPFLGAFAALGIGVLLVWNIKRATTIPTEALIGLMFAASLAIGILITPEPELFESLFGNIAKVKLVDGVLAIVLSIIVLAVTSLIRGKLILGLISPDLAKAQKIKIEIFELLFLILVAAIVALGVKVVGVLLMGALVIIPAAAAKNVAANLRVYGIVSAALGASSALLGVWAANKFSLPPGPTIVLIGIAIFLTTLISAKKS